MANDYWAYLREENELKHYRTPGALNKNPIKGTRLPDGTIVYDDKVSAAQARGQARQQQASSAAKSALRNQEERQGGKSAQTVKRAAVYNKSSRQTDGGEYGDVAIPGVEYGVKTSYGSKSVRNLRNEDGRYDTDANTKFTEQFLETGIQNVNNHSNNSVGGKVAAAQARGQARQRQASRAAKERLIERGNNGGGVKRDYPEADYFVEKVIHAPDRNEAKANLKKQQLKWRESQNQTTEAKIKKAYNAAKEKTLGAIDSIKRKLAKKR